jgi:hypothetical protein
MAREAGAIHYWHMSRLKAFEALVRADERDTVMSEPLTKAQWQRFEDEIRADEREACAKVCDELFADVPAYSAPDCAAAIRARWETK